MAAKPIAALAPSSSLHFENLPWLVLESICEYLAQCDARRRSLFALSLVSKRCCAITASQRFERIQLYVRDRLKLSQDIERWRDILEVQGRARHVRRIKVVGYMPHYWPDGRQSHDLQLDVALDLAEEQEDEWEYEGYEDNFVDPPQRHILFNSLLQWLENEELKQVHNESWQPLATFVSTLPALKDLVYSCLDQVAPCLLRSLHLHQPNCRLHVHTFSLRSLYQMKDDLHDIDPDEFMLATSPCLFAISISSSEEYNTSGHVDYHDEALFAMVSGMAPRLRHVRAWQEVPGASMSLHAAVSTPRPPWRGFFKNNLIAETTAGRLNSLSLGGEGNATPGLLADWDRHIDLSKLCSLEIRRGATLDLVQKLALMAESGKFVALRKLSLHIGAPGSQERSQLDAAIVQLLEKLQFLSELGITGYYTSSSFSTIMEHHGRFLHKLHLTPSECSPEMTSSLRSIQTILENCPNLSDLSLMIPRTMGDGREIAIYRALGEFPHLKCISLQLECSNQRWDELTLALPPEDLVREIFVNAAVDTHLARRIFRTISDANTSLPSPVESLRLSVEQSTFDHVWQSHDFSIIIRWIGRSWLCCRYPRNDHCGEITTDEIQARRREPITDYIHDDWTLAFEHGLVYEQAWNELWPVPTGRWMNDWESFPLAEESGDEPK